MVNKSNVAYGYVLHNYFNTMENVFQFAHKVIFILLGILKIDVLLIVNKALILIILQKYVVVEV
jgi:hypothetical protein